MHPRAKQLIEQLELQPHPEGGYFKEVYRSTINNLSTQCQKTRSAVTDIYFLLTESDVSRLHKVAHDEIWHLYEGAPLRLIELGLACDTQQEITLSAATTPPHYKHTIVANHWQGAESTGDFTLVGCTVAPGFDFEDFSFLADNPDLTAKLHNKFPKLKRFV